LKLLPDFFFLSFSYNFFGPNDKAFHIPHSLNFCIQLLCFDLSSASFCSTATVVQLV
jgi:hypothetical protein